MRERTAENVKWPQRVRAFVVERVTLATGMAFVAAFIFARFSAEFNEKGGVVEIFDRSVLAYCTAHQSMLLFWFAEGVSWISGTGPQIALVSLATIGFSLRRRFRPQGLSLLIASFCGAAVVLGLKTAFHRPRPQNHDSLGYSFPSGHTFMCVIIYGLLAYWLAREVRPTRRWLVWLVGILAMGLVGWSRVYLGEHYPSDVGAAYCSAFVWLWICLSLVPYISSFPKAHSR